MREKGRERDRTVQLSEKIKLKYIFEDVPGMEKETEKEEYKR